MSKTSLGGPVAVPGHQSAVVYAAEQENDRCRVRTTVVCDAIARTRPAS